MTRKEAIQNINALNAVCGQKDFYDEKFSEALYMAIKALEQEPCDDCVSREAVIETLKDVCDEYEVFLIGVCGQLPIKCVKAIYSLPSVQEYEKPKTGHWIPVSEKLPEESGEYLTTVKEKSTNKTFVDVSNLDADGIIKEWDWNESYKVIAWLPLPKPYKAESEDKE